MSREVSLLALLTKSGIRTTNKKKRIPSFIPLYYTVPSMTASRMKWGLPTALTVMALVRADKPKRTLRPKLSGRLQSMPIESPNGSWASGVSSGNNQYTPSKSFPTPFRRRSRVMVSWKRMLANNTPSGSPDDYELAATVADMWKGLTLV